MPQVHEVVDADVRHREPRWQPETPSFRPAALWRLRRRNVAGGANKGGERIECSIYRESNSYANGIRFYIDRSEGMVLDILRRQFADTSIIEM